MSSIKIQQKGITGTEKIKAENEILQIESISIIPYEEFIKRAEGKFKKGYPLQYKEYLKEGGADSDTGRYYLMSEYSNISFYAKFYKETIEDATEYAVGLAAYNMFMEF